MSNKKSAAKKKDHKKEPQTTPPKHFKIQPILLLSLIVVLVSIGTFALWEVVFANRIFPGINIAGISVAGLTKQEATSKVKDELVSRLNSKITFSYTQAGTPQTLDITMSPAVNQINIQPAIDQAFIYGHQKFFYQPVNIKVTTDQTLLDPQLNTLAKNIDQPAIDAQLQMVADDIDVSPSQNGSVVDKDQLKQTITTYINTGSLPQLQLPIKTVSPKLTYDSALQMKQRLDQIKLNNLKIVYQDKTYSSADDKTFTLDLPTILSLINSSSTQNTLAATTPGPNSITLQSVSFGNNNTVTDSTFFLDPAKTKQYLQTLATGINRDVQEPLFNFDPATPNRIQQFSPPTPGKQVDLEKSYERLNQAFNDPNQSTVQLAVSTINPKNQLSNNMGINELIGTGVSYFSGSIDNRIFNIGHGASKINGVLVPPGQEFSFDQTVGDITAATGFKQAYVITGNRTVLGDGGGICQVSTTLFRAVLNAGLPVTDRTAHAYRVHYYEEGGFGPGLDATVFYPSVDFRFKNDSPNYLLIQTVMNNDSLTVNLYGTSDGRVATVTNPVILSQTPPLPDLRQDDPTLPKGTVKQVDFSAWGANTVFKRTVVRNGQTIINESYKSNFRPWQAIYLVGTKEG